MDLSPGELRELAVIVLNHAEAVAKGAHTSQDTAAWNRLSFEDLKGRHVSNRRVSEIIHGANAWLKDKHPAIHEALRQNSENGGGLGSHPFIVRHLTDRYLAHEKESARSAASAKWPAKAGADHIESSVGPGGLLGGNPPGAAFVRRVRALQAADPSAGPANLPPRAA
jgi:hypothetical protein